MLLSYQECITRFRSDYQIKKCIESGLLYKVEKGIYSTEKDVSELSLIMMKYPRAVLTLYSALYIHDLTDVIPQQYYLATHKDDTKIADKRVRQSFDLSEYLYIGMIEMEYQGSLIRVYSKERMLVELIRHKRKIPYDLYKEVISNYRKIIETLDISLIQEYAFQLPKSRMIMEVIQAEVF